MQVRRTRYVLVEGAEEQRIDIAALLRGEVRVERAPGLRAISALTGSTVQLTVDDVGVLAALPDEWQAVDGIVATDALLALARNGLIVTDSDEPALVELRRRDEALAASHWHAHGAFYYAATRWGGVDVRGDAPEVPPPMYETGIEQALERQGTPPRHFHERGDARAVHGLPRASGSGEVLATLARRRTVRAFDRSRALPQEQLALVLDTVYGVRATLRFADDFVVLRKTSPSGGALHPIEAYPLVLDVEGVEPGLYHYAPHAHALEVLEALDAGAARELATTFVAGQSYLSEAHVLVVLAARFGRRFWKYRNAKAYSILLLEAGHLSQTNYLVCTALGLGAFVTAAINSVEIDERLRLDAASEGTLAICGIGIPSPEQSPLDAPFEPYEPRSDAL